MKLLGTTQMEFQQFNEAKQNMTSAVKSKNGLFLLYYNPQVSNMEYLRRFKALVNVINTGGGMSGHQLVLTKDH